MRGKKKKKQEVKETKNKTKSKLVFKTKKKKKTLLARLEIRIRSALTILIVGTRVGIATNMAAQIKDNGLNYVKLNYLLFCKILFY